MWPFRAATLRLMRRRDVVRGHLPSSWRARMLTTRGIGALSITHRTENGTDTKPPRQHCHRGSLRRRYKAHHAVQLPVSTVAIEYDDAYHRVFMCGYSHTRLIDVAEASIDAGVNSLDAND